MTVLTGTLSLGTGPGRIADVEALVRKVVDDRLRQWGAHLQEFDRDDLVSYLIAQCWELSGRYDPAKDRNPNFAAYAARILTLRVADWYRQRFGDTRHGARPVVLSLDAPARAAGDDGETGTTRLVDTLTSSTGDPADDRSPDLVGVLERGGRDKARPKHALGKQAAQGAARRTTEGARMKKKARVPGTYSSPAPICEPCFVAFFHGFNAANEARPEQTRKSELEIVVQAKGRARGKKVGAEWCCPRCTKLEDGKAQKMLLDQSYPSRVEVRHAKKAVARSKKQTAQSHA